MFLDINMPEMNGWEILEALNVHLSIIEKYLPIYVVSSSIDSLDKYKSSVNPLIKAFLSKPISNQLIRDIFNVSSK